MKETKIAWYNPFGFSMNMVVVMMFIFMIVLWVALK